MVVDGHSVVGGFGGRGMSLGWDVCGTVVNVNGCWGSWGWGMGEGCGVAWEKGRDSRGGDGPPHYY
jgi:hypothetical protein